MEERKPSRLQQSTNKLYTVPTSKSALQIVLTPKVINDGQNYKFDLNTELAKLIKAYSNQGLTNGLTKDEFISLANDLLSTIQYPKKLSKQQIATVFNMIDSNNDALISIQQLYRISVQNKQN